MLNVIDIFCGAGGLSAGFTSARAWWSDSRERQYQILYGVDSNEDAIATFRAFHSRDDAEADGQIFADREYIENVTSDQIRTAIHGEHVDVLIGGPNCQGVSAAGLRNPEDHRNEMLPAFIRLVEELQPSWFVMENVPGLTHTNNRELLCAIFEQFERLNYQVRGDVLLAADYGVPQLRYRLFIVGTNTGAPIRFPLPTHFPAPLDGNQQLPGITDTYKTVREAIGDLAKHTPVLYEENVTPREVALPKGLPHNHFCIRLHDISLTRIQSIPEGLDWRSMPIRWLPERYFATRASDQKGAYGRLSGDWPAYTITNEAYNVSAGPFTHPQHNRGLSVRETARLQSFSDEHVFYGSVISQYQQVGNAVPPRLAQAVAEAVLYCHVHGEAARNWGTAGRLDFQIIHAALNEGKRFPVLTRRHVQPSANEPVERREYVQGTVREEAESGVSAWDTAARPQDPFPEDTLRLRKLAEQPRNYRTAKRARAIISFLDGKPKAEIVREANASENSVKKWVDGYFAAGIDGWRAYHTPLVRISQNKPHLIKRMEKATARVRRTLLAPPKNGDDERKTPKRLHMNSYLLKLIERFGDRSVSQLIQEVETDLGCSIGTVYVGDLLAICDVVFDESLRALEQPFIPPRYSARAIQLEAARIIAMLTAISEYLTSIATTREKRQQVEGYLHELLSHSQKYVSQLPRRRMGDHEVDDIGIVDAIHALLRSHLDESDAVWVLDDVEIIPPNDRKPARPYNEIYVMYGSAQRSVLIDANLCLPRAFLNNREQRLAAQVPDSVVYQRKVDLGLAILKTARQRSDLSSPWIAAGIEYGQSAAVRDALAEDGWWYVLEIPDTTLVFTEQASVGVPEWAGRGKKPSRMRLLPDSARPKQASAVVTELLSRTWQAVAVSIEGDERDNYEYATLPVWECQNSLPTRQGWFIVWRKQGEHKVRLVLSNAPSTEEAATIVRANIVREISKSRWLGDALSPAKEQDYSWADWQRSKLITILHCAASISRIDRQVDVAEHAFLSPVGSKISTNGFRSHTGYHLDGSDSKEEPQYETNCNQS